MWGAIRRLIFLWRGCHSPSLISYFGDVRGIEDVYPLTPLQQGILFHALYAPGSGVYVEQLSCTLRGPLDTAAFAAAWRQVMASASDPAEFFPLGGSRCAGAGGACEGRPCRSRNRIGAVSRRKSRPGAGAAYLEADRQAGFDFAQAPLMRLALMRCADDRWLFLWSHHHVLLDGWSGPLIIKDAFYCISVASTGQFDPLYALQTIPRLSRLAVGSGHGCGGSLLAASAGGFSGADPLAIFFFGGWGGTELW